MRYILFLAETLTRTNKLEFSVKKNPKSVLGNSATLPHSDFNSGVLPD